MEDRFTAQTHTERAGATSGSDDDIAAGSDFIDFIRPLDTRLEVYDRTSPPTQQPKNDSTDLARGVPQSFIDAMIVREDVYVKEQGVPLANELDDEDSRCYHWVAYASVPNHSWRDTTDSPEGLHSAPRRGSTSTKLPVGTIRLVPPPNLFNITLENHRTFDGKPYEGALRSSFYRGDEVFILLGRLAVIKDFRKTGISKPLIESALRFAREHHSLLNRPVSAHELERYTLEDPAEAKVRKWHGLVLVHAQTGVQKVWKRYGFETDQDFGVWNEEGIEHVAMWKRLEGVKMDGGADRNEHLVTKSA